MNDHRPVAVPEARPLSASSATVAPAGATSATVRPSSPGSPGVPDGGAYAPRPRGGLLSDHPVARAVLAYLLVLLLAGALAGLVWHLVVDLPSYSVDRSGLASTSERGLAMVFHSDAWFCAIGAVLSLVAGSAAWLWFGRIGWPVVLLAGVGCFAAALMCWLVGSAMGPQDFAHRIATAAPGDRVPIDFALRSSSSLLVWPLMGLLPVLLGSSLAREEPRAPGRRTGRVPAPVEARTATPVPPPKD